MCNTYAAAGKPAAEQAQTLRFAAERAMRRVRRDSELALKGIPTSSLPARAEALRREVTGQPLLQSQYRTQLGTAAAAAQSGPGGSGDDGMGGALDSEAGHGAAAAPQSATESTRPTPAVLPSVPPVAKKTPGLI
jgi:hypothetical protein